MVAYRMSSVALADQVIHVESGRVVDVGTHTELLARDPGYRDLATAYQREAERRAAADELDGPRPRPPTASNGPCRANGHSTTTSSAASWTRPTRSCVTPRKGR
ncbi:hypothetical protein NKG05_29165 [Oerskovia sp. M15]